MSEDLLPLDSNQEQPPQEGQSDQQPQDQTGHIEVAYREGDPQIGDAALPGNTQESESSTAPTGESPELNGYSRNQEKAKLMQTADQRREVNLAESTPKEVGDRYDLEAAGEQIGKQLGEALQDAPEHRLESLFLHYSRVIAENYRKHGDELSINLQALELTAKFVARRGSIEEYAFGKYLTVKLNNERQGAIDITTSGRNIGNVTEKWHIPMFDDDPKSYSYNSRTSDSAYYEVTESVPDSDGAFDRILTKKTRSIGEADVANLGNLFRTASEYQARQWEEALHPGDEGYEEELREINYGRDN